MPRIKLYSKVLILFLCMLKFILIYSADRDYGVDFERAETVPGTKKTLYTFHVKLQRNDKREVCATGNSSFLEDFGNDVKVSVSVAISSVGSSNFVPSPMKVPPTNFCELLKTKWRDFVEPSTKETSTMPLIPEEGLCPYPKGTYEINCLKIVATDAWPNHFPKGHWRLTISFTKNDEFIGGHILYVNVYSTK